MGRAGEREIGGKESKRCGVRGEDMEMTEELREDRKDADQLSRTK
jgi:hypothetical protein